jgi:uncharacterized protein YodC (DUF2158 family)
MDPFPCRWYLGIQSKKDPAHVMTEVYKAMHILNCRWYKVNSYRVLCLWSALQPGEVLPQTIAVDDIVAEPHDYVHPQSQVTSTADMMMMMDDVDDVEPMSPQIGPDSAQKSSHLDSPPSGRGMIRQQNPNVKAALSLYKVQQSIYLLDFQRVEVIINTLITVWWLIDGL